MMRGVFRRAAVLLEINPTKEYARQVEKGSYVKDHTGDEGMSVMTAESPSSYKLRNSSFMDKITFLAKAGRGGSGGIFWYRFKNQPAGGPAGGTGGSGGSVFVQCTNTYQNLTHLINDGYIVDDPENELEDIGVCQAGSGINGDVGVMSGNMGQDVVMPLPPGTVIIDADTNRELVVLNLPGEKFELAKGGKGGFGNEKLKSSTLRAPDIAQIGFPGESKMYTFEFRTVADIALIGGSNSGKSTLLGAMSRSAPRPSPFKFTTWRPMVGLIHPDETSQYSMVDLPSLRKDSHYQDNSFLKHATRVSGIVYVMESTSTRTFKEQLEMLQNELNYYDEVIGSKAMAVAITKMDIAVDPITGKNTFDRLKEFQKEINLPIFPLSAHTKKGVLDFSLFLSKLMIKHREDVIKENQIRRRMLRVGLSSFEEIRIAEARQVTIQRMQDFHLSMAIQEIMKERIRSRPNFTDRETAGVEYAKEAAVNPDADNTNMASDDGIVYLEGMEEVNSEPFVLNDDIDIDSIPTTHPEDWGVGGHEDLQDDIRTKPLLNVWPSHVHELDQLDLEEREQQRSYGEAASILGAAHQELERSEYTKSMIGDSGLVNPNVNKLELASRTLERFELKRQSVKEGVLYDPPTRELPITETLQVVDNTPKLADIDEEEEQTFEKYIPEKKTFPGEYNLLNSEPYQPEKLHEDELWGSRHPNDSMTTEANKALKAEMANPTPTRQV